MKNLQIHRWYKSLELASHCMLEQNYCVNNLISIAEYIEKSTGVKANPVVPTIR